LDALMENAVNYTEEDGSIELSARREGPSVVLVVTDSGRGIPAAEVDRVLDRFARVDSGRSRATGGFGLGLAIVKAMGEAHGGSVRVRSDLGRGSSFELVVPELMAEDRTASPPGSTEPAADQP